MVSLASKSRLVVGAERLDQLKATLRDLVEAAEGDPTAGHDVGVAGADDA